MTDYPDLDGRTFIQKAIKRVSTKLSHFNFFKDKGLRFQYEKPTKTPNNREVVFAE